MTQRTTPAADERTTSVARTSTSVHSRALDAEDYGTGQALVRLPGPSTTSDRAVGPLLPPCTASRQASAVDWPAHRRTDAPERPPRDEQMADNFTTLQWEIGSEHANRAPRILAVFAHPDDESFCAGGTLAKYAAEGAEILVVSATRGDAGQIHDARAATRRTLGQVRERELRLACARLGIQHALCLDYGDGTLSTVAPEVLTRHIAQFVRAFRPDVVITFGPDGAYGHPDHIAIGAATTTACTLAGDAAAFPEQLAAGLAPHTPEATFHSHFPRHSMLLRDQLVRWLVTQDRPFCSSHDFMHALLVLAQEVRVLGYTADHVDVQWYPAGFSIVEQGEPASRLYLILSGAAEVLREDDEGMQHVVTRLEAGMFFGEEDLARAQASSAHVIAWESVTCLVFAPGAPTAFGGRGTTANPDLETTVAEVGELRSDATTAIDVSAYMERKIAAIAAHRTQCPITPDMLPVALLQALMGREYFVRVAPARELETELLARDTYAPVIRLHNRRPRLAVA